MLPKYIKVNNFASYVEETLDIENWGDILILTGENGCGKSSVIHMITVALFYRLPGVDAKGSGMDELIHQGCDSFKIEYCFSMNGNEYVVIREKTKKGQTLKLTINNEDHSGKLQETQQKIYDIIKMDYDTFMDTIIIGQGESASFMKKSATDRKKIIAQILRLDKYDTLEDYTKNLKKDLKSNLTITENKLNELYNSISLKSQYENSLENYKNELKSTVIELDKNTNELESEILRKAKHEQLLKQQQSIINRKNNINRNIDDCLSELSRVKNLKKSMEDVIEKKEITLQKISQYTILRDETINKINDTKIEITKLQTESNNYLKTSKELKEKYVKLETYNECDCQFCGQNISENYKEQHLKEIKSEAMKYITYQKQNETKITELKLINTENENDSKKYLNELNVLNELKSKIEKAEVKIESIVSKMSDLNKRLNELSEEKIEVDELEIIEMDNVIFRDNIIRANISKLKSSQSQYTTQIGILTNKLETISEDEIKYEEVKKKHDELKRKIVIYDELQKGWSRNGIQAIIIDNILPQIEDEINKYLGILSDNKISIKFETQKEAKNGNKSETLDIIVSDSKGSRSYERYSGGQRTRIDFACHIGMSKFLAKRYGSNIDFFVIDEGIGTLDESGKENLIDTIKLLRGVFKQIMVISHIPDIIESFDNKVLITNDIRNGSKVNILK